MSPVVWCNGELLDPRVATVSVFDHGLTVGDGVFETCKVSGGEVVALRRHLDRLTRSASGMGLTTPTETTLREAVTAVVAAFGEAPARLRITLTAGPAPLGSDRGDAAPTLVVAAAPLGDWPATARVATVPWPRNERGALVGLKTTSYGENVVALAEARRRGADEAIFANTAGELCEGTGSNIFLVLDGELLTPPLSSGCLAGITRALVCEVTEVTERPVPFESLPEAEEAFLTSSTRDVQPIELVDGRPLPAGPGPRTREAMAAFADLLARTRDP